MTRKRKRKTTPHMHDGKKSKAETENQLIMIRLDGGIWWPGYIKEGAGTFFGEEDEYSIRLTKTNHCEYSKDCTKIESSLEKLPQDMKNKYIEDLKQIEVASKASCQREAKGDSGTCGSVIDIHNEPGQSGSGGDIPGETAKSDSGTCGSGIDIHDEPGPSGSGGDIPGETAKSDSGTCGSGIDIHDEPGPSGSGGDIPGETAKSDSGTCGSGIDIHDEPGPSGSGGDIPGETAKSDSGTCGSGILIHDEPGPSGSGGDIPGETAKSDSGTCGSVIDIHDEPGQSGSGGDIPGETAKSDSGTCGSGIDIHDEPGPSGSGGDIPGETAKSDSGTCGSGIDIQDEPGPSGSGGDIPGETAKSDSGTCGSGIGIHDEPGPSGSGGDIPGETAKSDSGTCGSGILIHDEPGPSGSGGDIPGETAKSDSGTCGSVIDIHDEPGQSGSGGDIPGETAKSDSGTCGSGIDIHDEPGPSGSGGDIPGETAKSDSGTCGSGILIHDEPGPSGSGGDIPGETAKSDSGTCGSGIDIHDEPGPSGSGGDIPGETAKSDSGTCGSGIDIHDEPGPSGSGGDIPGETAKSDSGTCGSGIDIHDEPGPSGSGGDIPGETAKSDSGTCGSGIDIHDEPGPSGSVGDIPGETAKSDSGTCGSGIDIHDEPGPSGSGGDIPGEPSFILDLLSYQGSWEVQESADIELEDSLDISLDKDISSGSEYLPQSGDSDEESFDIERETVSTSTYTDVVANSCSESDDDNGSDVFPMLISTDLEVAINKPAVIEPGDSDSDIEPEDEILRDKEKPGIYIKKVSKSATTKTGKVKKNERVYNSYQFCGVCGKKVSNFAQHIERNKRSHEQSLEIKKIQEETDKKKKDDLRTILRGKFNNAFNMETLKKGKGEILLERRPTKAFNLSDFGPCPKCLLWIAKKLMRKHQKTCVVRGTGTAASSMLITQSDIISKRLTAEASENLVTEVFQVMLNDEVGKVAREDPLLIHLGNIWMEKNVDNKLKRGCYTSQILRLVARLFLQLKEMKPLADGKTLWDYLQPQYFDVLAEATLSIADPSKEDAEDLAKPSNAVKLGYDLKRLINCKIGLSIMGNDQKSRQDAEDLLKTMQIFWGSKVTKLARVLLERRKYNKREQLPMPEDIEKLSTSLKKTITELDLDSVDPENFQHVAEVMSARLLMYNRRRTGELQAIGLEDYQKRKRGDAEAAEKILGECTALEKKLLDDQELMTVRGKTGRGVPVIIPKDCRSGLHFLCNQQIRRAAGIAESNEYIFAYKDGVVRAYDSLAKACRRADLDKCLTSTNLRKYMATMTQVLDLKENELNWVLNHLGHTLDVHKIHYRCTSDVLEKAQIAKILLLQDHGLMGKYHNKTLTDIQLEDLVADQGCDKDMEMEDVLDVSEKMGLEEEEEEVEKEGIEDKKPRKKIKSVPRQGWEWEEEEEIKSLFQKYFSKNEKPKPVNIRKMMLQSKANGGKIHLRKVDILKKKIFRMIDKNSSK